MVKFMRIFVFAAVVLMLFGFLSAYAIDIGADAPEFSLKDINGKTVSLSDFKGKVVILDFFASWCPPCRQEVPDFIQLQNAYADKGFAMIGVAVVTAQEAKDFVDKMSVNYPVLVDDEKVSGAYGPIRSIPTTFLIDKNGKIVKMYIGFRPKSTFESDIKELLK